MDMSDRYRLRDDNSPVMEKSHALIYLWKGLISCYQIFPPISAHGLISLWDFRCLRMDEIDVITYKYVIIYNYQACESVIWRIVIVEKDSRGWHRLSRGDNSSYHTHTGFIIVLLHRISYTVLYLFGLVQIWPQTPSDDPYSINYACHVRLTREFPWGFSPVRLIKPCDLTSNGWSNGMSNVMWCSLD